MRVSSSGNGPPSNATSLPKAPAAASASRSGDTRCRSHIDRHASWNIAKRHLEHQCGGNDCHVLPGVGIEQLHNRSYAPSLADSSGGTRACVLKRAQQPGGARSGLIQAVNCDSWLQAPDQVLHVRFLPLPSRSGHRATTVDQVETGRWLWVGCGATLTGFRHAAWLSQKSGRGRWAAG